MAPEPTALRWRTGRKVGNTIYRQLGEAPSDDDPIIGFMSDPADAALAVAVVTAAFMPVDGGDEA